MVANEIRQQYVIVGLWVR